MEWTKEQRRAITEIDGNMLVSASAGSGKTAVMIERIIELIKDKKTPISRLLVVTFASDAAEGMKRRLVSKLADEVRKGEGDIKFLLSQINSIDTANISTIHSFCLEIVKTYFYVVDIDPQVKVISPADNEILKRGTLDALIDDRLQKGDEQFIRLMEIFSAKRKDIRFKDLIMDIYEFLMAKPLPKEYLSGEFLYLFDNISAAFDIVMNAAVQKLGALSGSIAANLKSYSENSLLKTYESLACLYCDIKNICAVHSYDGMREGIFNLALDRFDRMTNKFTFMQLELLEMAKAIREELKKVKEDIAKQFVFSESENIRMAAAMRGHMVALADFMTEYIDRLDAVKRKESVIDFSDFEHLTLKILQSQETREALKARFEYIFVDEYQDTNAVQEKIVSEISNNNVFMVGDVKQSIYSFRQCDVGIFMDKYERFSGGDGGTTVKLNMNFRSRQNILDFSNLVFGRVMKADFGGSDYLKDSMFVAGKEDDSKAAKVEVMLISSNGAKKEVVRGESAYDLLKDEPESVNQTAKYEARLIANIINGALQEEIYDGKLGKNRRLQLSDIAILTRSFNPYVKSVKSFLELEAGLPIVSTSDDGASVEVLKLIDLLKVIDNPYSDYPLISTMLSVVGAFNENELSLIKIAYSQNVQKEERGKHFHEAVMWARENLQTEIGDKIRTFYDNIAELRELSTFSSIARVLSNAISKFAYDEYVLRQKYGEEKYSKVLAYLDMLEGSRYKYSLGEYLREIDMGGEIKLPSTVNGYSRAITMMTIHKSKGLEFPMVILIDAGKKFNFMDINMNRLLIDRNLGCGIDYLDAEKKIREPLIIKQAVKQKIKLQTLEEELRLLYVALTRAENMMFITSRCDTVRMAEFSENRLPMQASSYLDYLSYELMSVYDSENGFERCKTLNKPYNIKVIPMSRFEEPAAADEKVRIRAGETDAEFQRALHGQLSFKYSYDTELANKYSVTKLAAQNFSEDEQSDKSQILFSDDSALALGTAYHAILERIDLFNCDLAEIERTHRLLIDRNVIDESLKIDYNIIYNVTKSQLISGLQGAKIYREREFMLYIDPRTLSFDSENRVLVQGKIDLLAVQDGKATIVDFKTSNIFSRAKAIESHSKQLDMYAVAIEGILGLKVERRIVYALLSGKYFEI